MQSTDSHDGQRQDATVISQSMAPPGGQSGVIASDLFKPGDQVGGSYEIVDQLGSGAMGLVFRVRHSTMLTEYALKVLTTAQLDENAVVRFQHEAQAIAQLNHPNIISIYNYGLHDGRLPFYVMDLLQGQNLLDVLDKRGPLPIELALPLFVEICSGLSYAHRKGILHRDVKPANFVILDTIDAFGARVKVVDFGLVKFDEALKPDIQKLTAVGEVCGSPSYMSPEQSSSQKVDARSDIYSLGCSLFQAITGKLPFRGRNATETMLQHHEAPPPTLASMGGGKTFPPDLELLVAKMMAKAPMDRYQSMDSVAQALGQIMEDLGLVKPKQAPTKPRRDGHRLATSSEGKAGESAETLSGSFASKKTIPTDTTDDSSAAGQALITDRYPVTTGKDESERFETRPNERSIGTGINKTTIAVISIVLMCLAGSAVFLIGTTFQPDKHTATITESPERKNVDWGKTGAPGNTSQSSSTGQGNPTDLSLSEPNSAPNSPFQNAFSMEETCPTDVPNVQYFSTTISKNGSQFNEFHFTNKENVKAIAAMGTTMNDFKPTLGTVIFPKGAPIYLSPLPVAKNTPQFFEKFRPGEIAGLFLNPWYADDALFNSATRVPGLTQLMLFHCSLLTEKIVPALSKLKLELLVADELDIDGEQLASANIWQNLVILDLTDGKHVSPVLRKLSGSQKIELLNLSRNDLNQSDYELIARMPELKFLILNGDIITKDGLHALSKLPKLNTLAAVQAGRGRASISEELKQCHALKRLLIGPGFLGPNELKQLARERPDLSVTMTSGEHDRRGGQGMLATLKAVGIKGLKTLPAFMTEEGGMMPGSHRQSGGGGGFMRMMRGFHQQYGGGKMPNQYGDHDDDDAGQRPGSGRSPNWRGQRGAQGPMMRRFGQDQDDRF